MKKQLHSHPRKFGKDSRGCRVTGACQGLIRKYGINMSRRTFREQAELIGFQKYRWTSMGSKALSQQSYSRDLIDRMNETKMKHMLCHYKAILWIAVWESLRISLNQWLVLHFKVNISLVTKQFFFYFFFSIY